MKPKTVFTIIILVVLFFSCVVVGAQTNKQALIQSLIKQIAELRALLVKIQAQEQKVPQVKINCGQLIYFSADNEPYSQKTNPIIESYAKNSGCVEVIKHNLATITDMPDDSLAKKYNVTGSPSFIFVDKDGCYNQISDKGGATTLEDVKNGIANFKCLKYVFKITTPKGGEELSKGIMPIGIKWEFSNMPDDQLIDKVSLRAYPNGQEYNLNTSKIPLTDKRVALEIPNSIPSGQYTLEMSGYAGNNLIFAYSNPFKIFDSLISITYPNVPENWKIGEVHNITWQSNNVSYVNIELFEYVNSSSIQRLIASNVPSLPSGGSYSWNVGKDTYGDMILTPGNKYKIAIYSSDMKQVYKASDLSDNYFSIVK